ncbi:unnamed protein product [Clonostachys rhizophaga]|uniref:Uncharacterized protein n=1 Tax=Clonostachys rhizophaga TaxID=160324 RepID=A0A9N9YFC3_9HYPO|nr:unnamed protein product [Clonostachys rhizophaga]
MDPGLDHKYAPANYNHLASNDRVLIAKAYIFDTVKEVGKELFQSCDRIEYLQELSRFVQSRKTYPTGEIIEDLVWKIPIGDSIEPISPDGDRVNFRVAYQAFTEYLQLAEQGKDWKMEIMQARAMAKIKTSSFTHRNSGSRYGPISKPR